ncbi:MAG TPA: MFS transporter [Clostridiaceae bacterium]|nr:MFS transporter [Clostridiaceae bacterium]
MSEQRRQRQTQKTRIWSRNFFLLWQGQLISGFGDAVYTLAIGFYVLRETGSTSLMGLLMASNLLPRVLASTVSGAVADRYPRGRILILMDLLRGSAVIIVGLLALAGRIEIWFLFAAGAIIGFGSAFFNPAVQSIIPDIVRSEDNLRANSIFQIAQGSSLVAGNAFGGILFRLFGPAVLFLFNGVSYLYSAVTELFLKVPRHVHHGEKPRFRDEVMDGYRFVYANTGLRYLMTAFSGINFFTAMASMLFLPLFHNVATLGEANYGFAMATILLGTIGGMVFTSAKRIPFSRKFRTMVIASVVLGACAFPIPFIHYFLPMVPFLLGIGFCIAIISIMINSTIQIFVPQEKRGKILGLTYLVTQGITPVGYVIGGVLSDLIGVRNVLLLAFLMITLIFFYILPRKEFHAIINFDPRGKVGSQAR